MPDIPLEPIIVREIFPDLRAALLAVLGRLSDDLCALLRFTGSRNQCGFDYGATP